MSSRVIIGTALNSHVRFYLGDTRELCQTAKEVHDLWPTSLAALGRTMSVTACMGLMQKGEDESVTVTINGGGPLGTCLVTANNQGQVKGFVSDPHLYLKYNESNKLAVGLVVGTEGYLKVLKNLKMKQSYTSQVKLQSGEIGDDFAYYFSVSQQTPTIVSVGVLVDVDYSCKSAGVLLIELLPDHTEEDIVYLEGLLRDLEPISTVLERNNDLEAYIKTLFADALVLEEKELSFYCDCSRERFLANFLTLPKQDILDLAKEDEIEVVCEFCQKKYVFDKRDMDLLMKYVSYR